MISIKTYPSPIQRTRDCHIKEKKRIIKIILFLFFIKSPCSSISEGESSLFKVYYQGEDFYIKPILLKIKLLKESFYDNKISLIFTIFNKISFTVLKREGFLHLWIFGITTREPSSSSSSIAFSRQQDPYFISINLITAYNARYRELRSLSRVFCYVLSKSVASKIFHLFPLFNLPHRSLYLQWYRIVNKLKSRSG